MEADKDDGDYFLVLLQRWCDLTLQWDERSNSCRRLADLVDQRSVRDHTEDKLDEETYRLLITSVLLGWQQQKQEEMKAVQTFFVEMMSIPEFENAAVEKFVDDGFLIQLCGRFQAGDPEERLFLRNTLHWAYNSFPRSRPLLRRQIGTVLGHFARAPSRNTHVAQMLEVLCQIIKGFPESLTDVHRSLLVDILLPLHEPNQMLVWGTQEPLIGSYHEALVACLVPFLEREADLVQTVLEAIVAAWPQGFDSNTPKEVMLLHEVGTLFKFVRPDRCGAGLHVVMPKILECLRVDNSRVVERALFLFKDDDFMELLGRQTGQVMEPLVSALLRGGEPCWNPTVTKMTAHVLESLEKLDPETFASACETLWGAGTSPVADVTLDSAEKESVPSVPSAQVTPKASGTADHPLPPTTLAAAMGTWRPPAKDGIRQPGAPKVAQNPPATITGVAPWAFQTAPPSGASRVARGVKSSRMSGQGKTLPPYTLKRPLPCDSAVPDVSDNRSNNAVLDVAGTADMPTGASQGASEKATADSSSPMGSIAHTVNDTSSGKRTGAGLRRVREFIQELKPKHVEGQAGSWREQQLEPTPTLLPDLRFHDLVFGHELGQGSFSSVKYARQITKGRPQGDWPEFAVKIISTTKIKELHYEKSVTNEIACLRVLSHPGIARLISAFRWRDGAYLVLEYASRGDLHTHIKQHGSLSEVSARFVIGEVLAALCSVHDCGFVFGDLKPENILITESGHIKIADFGACRPTTADAKDILSHSRDALRTLRDGDWRAAAGLPPNPVYTLPVEGSRSDSDSDYGEDDFNSNNDNVEPRTEGTAAYLPPEVARGGIPDVAADAWALGCVTFLCLAGRPPIFADTDEAIMARVVHFSLPSAGVAGDGNASLPSEVSQASQRLVRALMEPDRAVRLSVESAARHEFFSESSVDVFSLHKQKPVELAQGTVAPTPNAAWSRRQNSMIWAPMPQEYRLDAISTELEIITESDTERRERFRQRLRAIPEP